MKRLFLEEWRRESGGRSRFRRSPSLLDEWRSPTLERAQGLANSKVSGQHQPRGGDWGNNKDTSYRYEGLATALVCTVLASVLLLISVKLLATTPIFM